MIQILNRVLYEGCGISNKHFFLSNLQIFIFSDEGDDVSLLIQLPHVDCVFDRVSIFRDIVSKSRI